MPAPKISDFTRAINFIESADPLIVAEFRRHAATIYTRRGITPKVGRKPFKVPSTPIIPEFPPLVGGSPEPVETEHGA